MIIRFFEAAVLADARHNLSDVCGLALAWAELPVTRLRPDDLRTYGWRRGSIPASFANALLLLGGQLDSFGIARAGPYGFIQYLEEHH
jgi:Co/Zn/Cd efflux system component